MHGQTEAARAATISFAGLSLASLGMTTSVNASRMDCGTVEVKGARPKKYVLTRRLEPGIRISTFQMLRKH